MALHQNKKASYFSLLLLFILNSCAGQNAEPKAVSITKIHQDSISVNAATLPEFKVDVHDKESQGNQISGVIRTVFQDSKGNYWFGTQDGLCRKDKNGLFYFDLKDSNNQGVTVHTIIEDTNGIIWIGYGGGIAKYDGSYFTVFHQKDILLRTGLWSMTMDKKGILWIGTTQGVFTFDGKTLTPFEIPEGKINPSMGISTAKMVHSIIEDRNGNMWFATNGGAYKYDGTSLKNISEKDGLQSNFVSTVIESKMGYFYIAISKAIYKYDGNTLTNITEKLIKNDDSIGCVYEDKEGTLWFSVNKREIYNYNTNGFTKVKNKDGDFSPFPFQIYQDLQNRFWFVGFKGAYRLDNGAFVNVTRDGPW